MRPGRLEALTGLISSKTERAFSARSDDWVKRVIALVQRTLRAHRSVSVQTATDELQDEGLQVALSLGVRCPSSSNNLSSAGRFSLKVS